MPSTLHLCGRLRPSWVVSPLACKAKHRKSRGSRRYPRRPCRDRRMRDTGATTRLVQCVSPTECGGWSKPLFPTSSKSGTAVCSNPRSEEHTSELQSRRDLVCRLLLEKKKKIKNT